MKQKIINLIPSVLTMCNAICGTLAILITVFYNSVSSVTICCILILIGAFFDSIDGYTARKLNVVSPIGKELDSFADLISFGIAPALITMELVSMTSSILMFKIAVIVIYVLCAVYRLARFNAMKFSGVYQGLPSTISGMLLAIYCLTSNLTRSVWSGSFVFEIITTFVVLSLGLLMISQIKVKKL